MRDEGNGDFRETELGALPVEWNVFAVKDKFTFTQKPRGLRYDAFESIPFVPMEVIPFRKIAFHDYILKKPNEFSSGTYFEAGDFLLPKITPSFENGKQGIIPKLPNGFGVATTEVIPISGIDHVSDIGFLFYYLLKDDVRVSLAGKMEGSTGRQRLSKAVVESLLIPFPPLPEQRAIARVLTTIQRGMETQDKLIAAARELKKSLMRQLFTQGLNANGAVQETEIGLMPEHWELVKLGEIADFKNGINFGREQKGSGILTVDVLNMYSDSIKLDMRDLYRVNINLRPDYLLERGDILFVRSSFKLEGVGWSTLFDGYSEPVTYCGFLIRARLLPNHFHPDFLVNYLRQPQVRGVLVSRSGKVAITNINQGNLKSLGIPKPPLSEQREIARILATADKKIETEEKRKAALEALFKTMLQNLMTGKIRVT